MFRKKKKRGKRCHCVRPHFSDVEVTPSKSKKNKKKKNTLSQEEIANLCASMSVTKGVKILHTWKQY